MCYWCSNACNAWNTICSASCTTFELVPKTAVHTHSMLFVYCSDHFIEEAISTTQLHMSRATETQRSHDVFMVFQYMEHDLQGLMHNCKEIQFHVCSSFISCRSTCDSRIHHFYSSVCAIISISRCCAASAQKVLHPYTHLS